MPIHSRNREFYAVPKDGNLRNVWGVRFENLLDSILHASDFQPREVRAGWAFFQRHDVSETDAKFYKFWISDVTGEEITTVLPAPTHRKDKVEVQPKMGGLTFTGQADISAFRLRYYHSSYPP
jgi:hypothetical protein